MRNMYSGFFLSELKKWSRDSMMRFMLIYPLFLGLLGRYVLPWVYENNSFPIAAHADFILTFLALLTPTIYGGLIAFSILDDRDDNILSSINVTPMTVFQFLSFKFLIATAFAFLGCLFVFWFTAVYPLGLGNMIALSFLAAISAPLTGLFINAFAKNKIEGFAVMKGFGTLAILPVVSLFFVDAKELIFVLVPGFWPAKAISALVRGEGQLLMSFNTYYFVGLAYALLATVAAYRLFSSKTQEY